MDNKEIAMDTADKLMEQENSLTNLILQELAITVNNALVEEASCTDNSNGRLLISYTSKGANQEIVTHKLQLQINRNTIVMNSFGQRVGVCRIKPQMFVNAVYSPRMTRSNPPVTNAFLVVVKNQCEDCEDVATDRIAYVDTENNYIYTGSPNDINSQVRYVVTGATPILDRIGRRISIQDLRPGQMVRITYALFMTASIPPQTVAYRVQLT